MPIALLLLSLAATEPAVQDRDARPADALATCLAIDAAGSRGECLERTAREIVAAARRERVADGRSAVERFGMPAGHVAEARIPRAKPAPLPRVDHVDGVVAAVAPALAGQWTFTLADGSRWVTQESGLSAPPRAGQALVIKRGALGSYRVIFAGERPLQAQRVR